jgi:RNAse (barnase) inhibitor barstar
MKRKKVFIIDGENFNDINSFFDEIDRIFTKNLSFRTGHNFNAFNDILRGGFGVKFDEMNVKIKWLNFSKSQKDLGNENIEIIIEIITNTNNSGHYFTLELVPNRFPNSKPYSFGNYPIPK